MNDTDMIGPYVKPSVFTQAVIGHLGEPEKWCKKALAILDDGTEVYSADFMELKSVVSGRHIQSACLEGAIGLAMYQFGDDSSCWTTASDVRRQLRQQMQEQFPDFWPGGGPCSLPFYNDHESMTYEGVRAVLDKTLVYFQEKNL